MRRIQSAKRGEELPAFQLQVERQARGLHKGFLDFDIGFIVVVQFENNISEPFEVRIDRAVKRELDIARVEAALLWIVIANLDVMEIACARVSQREQPIERDVHVIFAATDSDWLR